MGFVAFTQRTARAQTPAQVGTSLLDAAPELVGARAVGMYLFDGPVHARGIPDRLLDQYESMRPYDPVARNVTRFHAPWAASREWMLDVAIKQRMPEWYIETIDPNVGLHYMAAPVIIDGSVAGTLHFARGEDRAFGTRELSVASAFALHVSSRLAALRALDRVDETWADALTLRGLEVAELAARGLTTFEIGRLLGVSPNTVKKHLRTIYARLSVSSRAELATLLATRPKTK